MIEFLKEFFYEVDWSEPWLISLLAFHVITAISIILLRRHSYIQAAILAVLALLCLSMERMNEYAALNYKKFSRQQYFDTSGVFISLVFAIPVIANCLLIVLCWFVNVWQLLVQVGTLKVKRQQRAKQSPTSDNQRTPSNTKEDKKRR